MMDPKQASGINTLPRVGISGPMWLQTQFSKELSQQRNPFPFNIVKSWRVVMERPTHEMKPIKRNSYLEHMAY